MKFSYFLKESIRGFSSAKLSTFASIITISLSLILISVYYFLSDLSNEVTNTIKGKVEVEVFLFPSASPQSLDSLKESIKRMAGVRQMTFISKDDAAKIFEQEFGKEMLDVFEVNPLPPSIKISLYNEYKSLEQINKMTETLEKSPIVESIEYPRKSLELIEENSSTILTLNLIILLVLIITSIFLVSNTIRLVIYSKKKTIETLKLLGATKIFIRTPFIIEGFLQGLAGGLIAALILYIIFLNVLESNDILLGIFNATNILILIIIGITLGILGSTFSVSRFIKESINA